MPAPRPRHRPNDCLFRAGLPLFTLETANSSPMGAAMTGDNGQNEDHSKGRAMTMIKISAMLVAVSAATAPALAGDLFDIAFKIERIELSADVEGFALGAAVQAPALVTQRPPSGAGGARRAEGVSTAG